MCSDYLVVSINTLVAKLQLIKGVCVSQLNGMLVGWLTNCDVCGLCQENIFIHIVKFYFSPTLCFPSFQVPFLIIKARQESQLNFPKESTPGVPKWLI